MPRIKLPGINRGWHTLAVESTQPAHLTRDDGSVVDLDVMLRRMRLIPTDFSGAPSHKPVRDPRLCKNGHPWTPDTTTTNHDGYRVCRLCKDINRQRARLSAKRSHARKKATCCGG